MYHVHRHGINHNTAWRFNDIDGHQFEDDIYNAILKELKQHIDDNEVRVMPTPGSNDGGKDIIIYSSIDFILFGTEFKILDRDIITIYIECKCTNKQLLFDKIIGNVVRSGEANIQYFVLVTNSTINPSTYKSIENQLKIKNDSIQFVLIDQYLLAKSINSRHTDIFGIIPMYCNTSGQDDSFYLEYQISPFNIDNKNGYEIDFLFRNYGDIDYNCKLELATNINWTMNERTLNFIVTPNRGISKVIHLENASSDELNSLIFNVQYNNNGSILEIESINLTETFIPPFIGAERYDVCEKLYRHISTCQDVNIYSIWGEAGIGKSRIVFEAFNGKQHNLSLIDKFECYLQHNNENVIKRIIDFLYKKHYITEKDYSIENFANTICQCTHSVKTALIIIDDFHHASKSFIEQIKLVYKKTTSVKIVICGRTDFSFGSNDYYAFINWTSENFKKGENYWEILPLQEAETAALIKIMINRIPDDALKMLQEKCNNNPLFITQYIEYLIGEKLVYVVNRNSVGIIDLAKFNAKKYIPDKISKIYEQRIKHLKSKDNFEELFQLLLVIAVYNGEIAHKTVLKYFDDLTLIGELVDSRFLIFKNNCYRFIHESFCLFMQELLKKYTFKISKYILSKHNDIARTFSKYHLGRLYLWAKENDKAAEQFKDMISIILNQSDNISNISIKMESYEYLNDIYTLYKNKKGQSELLKKVIKTRIYITLHHLMPYNAVLECDHFLNIISENQYLKDDTTFYSDILAQKAHALMNSGKNFDGFLILNELQSKWILNKCNVANDALFDVFDRLLASYIKFNVVDIAKNYAALEMNVAKYQKDKQLEIIANRTHAKLFHFLDYKQCIYHLDEVDKIVQKYPSPRLETNNKLYRMIVQLTYGKIDDYCKAIEEINSIINFATNNDFHRAIIQGKMVLAALLLLFDRTEEIKAATTYINAAINNSVAFGINSYLWQLYNLMAIAQTKMNFPTDTIKETFHTVFEILRNQDLTYIGKKDLCYSNVLAISNIGIFYNHHSTQDVFNSIMSRITYVGEITKNNREYVPPPAQIAATLFPSRYAWTHFCFCSVVYTLGILIPSCFNLKASVYTNCFSGATIFCLTLDKLSIDSL